MRTFPQFSYHFCPFYNASVLTERLRFAILEIVQMSGNHRHQRPLTSLEKQDSWLSGLLYHVIFFSDLYILSAFEGNVVSCDTITDGTDIPKKIQKVLLVGAATLARLHKSGVAHGDAQIKNTAFSVKTGEERAIDLTSSYFDKSGRGIIDDIHSYIGTLPDYISPVLDDEHIKEYFIDPYLSLVAGALSKKQQDSVHRVTSSL